MRKNTCRTEMVVFCALFVCIFVSYFLLIGGDMSSSDIREALLMTTFTTIVVWCAQFFLKK